MIGNLESVRKLMGRGTVLALGTLVWMVMEQESHAAVLLAQQGMPKTAIGWTLVLLCLVLGLLVMLRPNGRRFADPNDQPAPKVTKKGPQQRAGGHGGH